MIHRRPLKGDAIAKIMIPSIGVSKYVVEGTDVDSLRKGPGHYPETPLPGEPGTTAIAGHRTTYGAPFRHIDEVQHGEPVIIDMPDGRFVYRVQRTKIVDDQDLSVLDRVGYQRLVLSACHPLYSAAQRIIVFARLDPGASRRGSDEADRHGRVRVDGRLVAGLEEEDQADHQRERDRDDRDPVHDLAERSRQSCDPDARLVSSRRRVISSGSSDAPS